MPKIFVASTGRCGTVFMTEIFKHYTNYPSFHEPKPYCAGQTLREVNNNAGMTKASKLELQEKLNQIARDSDKNGNYFESCQMFIKSYFRLIAYKKDFMPIYVIYLHRNPIEVLLSYIKKLPNLDLGWFLQPHWSKNEMSGRRGLTFCEIALWQWYEVRERFLIWRDKFAKTWDFDFRDINNPNAWAAMFNHFGIKHKPLPNEFPINFKKNELKANIIKVLVIAFNKWHRAGFDKTISATDHFFEDMNKRIIKEKSK